MNSSPPQAGTQLLLLGADGWGLRSHLAPDLRARLGDRGDVLQPRRRGAVRARPRRRHQGGAPGHLLAAHAPATGARMAWRQSALVAMPNRAVTATGSTPRPGSS